ncbi:cyclic nucleotide-binding domain-containing protein [Solidesulfovibrio sp.]
MSLSTDQRDGHSVKACGFNDHLDILRELPLFTGVPLDVVKVLAYLSTVETFAVGETLCDQGEPLDRCCYVLCGEVAVVRTSGDCEATMLQRGESYCFGGLGLLAATKAVYTVRVTAPVQCLTLTREKFLKTAERFPAILPKILGNVVEHIFRWEEAFLSAHAEECAGRGGEMGLSLF